MMGENDTGGLSKYVVATIIFFGGLGGWLVIGWFLGLMWWFYPVIVVLWLAVAAVVIKYLEPKLEDY